MATSRKPRIAEIDIDRIREHPDNVRTVMTGLEGLAASIRRNGLQHHIVVHHKFEQGPGVQDLELVDGARRLAAHHINQASTIRAEVRPYMEPDEILIFMIASTFREDPDAAGMQIAVDKLRKRHSLTPLQIAERLGTSEGQVWAWLRGNGRVVEAPVNVGPTPSPARPVPAEMPSTSAMRGATMRARRGSARTPTIRASRIFDMVEAYERDELDGDELAKRLRGALGGWRPA